MEDNSYLDSVLGVVATSVHIKTGVHAAAEVPPLGNGTGYREPDKRCVVDAALVEGPVRCGLNRVGPKLKHSGGDQSEQHHGEKGDVVNAVLDFHPWDQSGTPRVVFPRGIHG